MTRRRTQSATQRRDDPEKSPVATGSSAAPSGLLTTEETGGSTTPPPDPLLKLFQQAEEEALRQRLKAIRRAETMERHQQKKAGHAGELTATLDVPRRYWPHVHEAAIRQKIPIRTERLPRHATTPVRLLTSESGALRLRLALQQVEVPT